MEHKVDFNKVPWESPMAGMRQKVHRLGNRQLRVVEYSAGLAPHWCEKGHVGYILKGQLEIRFETGTETFSSGDGIAIPAGEKDRHMAIIRTDRTTVFFLEDI